MKRAIHIFMMSALFVALLGGAAYAAPECPSGAKPPCPPSVSDKIHPLPVVIDLTGAGLRITHGPAGIIIDITGAGYTCTGTPGPGPVGSTTCSGGSADVTIRMCQLSCCDCFHPDPPRTIISFHADSVTVTADGLVVSLQAGYNDHVGLMNYIISSDGMQIALDDTLPDDNVIASLGRDGMVYCIAAPCDAENSIRINPQGVLIDTNDLIFPGVVEGTFFTRDCLDHDHCLQAENNDGAVTMTVFGSLTRIKIVWPGMTLKIPNFTATRT